MNNCPQITQINADYAPPVVRSCAHLPQTNHSSHSAQETRKPEQPAPQQKPSALSAFSALPLTVCPTPLYYSNPN
jgi:hypothetical protein